MHSSTRSFKSDVKDFKLGVKDFDHLKEMVVQIYYLVGQKCTITTISFLPLPIYADTNNKPRT